MGLRGNMNSSKLMKHATCFNILCTVHGVEISPQNQPYTHWNVLCTAIKYSVLTQNTSKTLPILGFRGGLRTTANYLVKIVVPPLTACLELKELSPLLF
jgi:hypothetical protein